MPDVKNLDLSSQDITRYIVKDSRRRDSQGSGAAGDVYKCIYDGPDRFSGQRVKRNVAIKVLVGRPNEIEKLRIRVNREVVAWQSLSHPNVLPFMGVAYLSSNPHAPPGLVSPWIERSKLLDWIGRHPEAKHQKAQEIAAGLEYLHSHDVVHGDLKVDNVMISNDLRAQIADFGIARVLGVVGFTTIINRNVRFAAPELMPIVMNSQPIRPTLKSDIYSLGLLFVQLFHGPDSWTQRGLPYNHFPQTPSDLALVTKVHSGERPRRERYNPISDQHWALMEWCWNYHPNARPSIAQVRRAL